MRELSLAIPESDQPLDDVQDLAVSSSGDISYAFSADDTPPFRTVDSSGAVVSRWGRFGEGPGEIREIHTLYSMDSGVAYLAPESRHVALFKRDGSLLRESRGDIDDLPVAINTRGIVLNLHFTDHAASSVVWRPYFSKSGGGTLVPQDDSLLRMIGRLAARSGRWPISAWDGQRLVIADGYSYSLVEYHPDSTPEVFQRTLEPRVRTAWEFGLAKEEILRRARVPMVGPTGQRSASLNSDSMIKRVQTDTLPHFVPGGMGFDGNGRLWVIGQTHDSTFADVFADTTFLGRRMIDCRSAKVFRAIAIHGRWLAMSCARTTDDQPEEIRLFRMEEL